MNNLYKRIYYLLLISSISIGASLLSIVILPFETLKKVGGQLAHDGNFERLTFELIHQLTPLASIFGTILTILSISFLLWRKKFQIKIRTNIGLLNSLVITLYRDGRQLLSDIQSTQLSSLDSILLATISLLAIGLRLLIINRPIEYDEAYTFIEFARHSFKVVLTDYNVPNNHVFHTILVRISYLLFDGKEWQIRLPTFISSIILVISMYFLARNYYNRIAAILASLLTASIPLIVVKSVSARGYIMISLMMVFALLLTNYVRIYKNKAAWILLALSCSIGLYTIPLMVYPCGFIFLWLIFLGATKQTSQAYKTFWDWVKHIVGAGIMVIVFTGILYLPIIVSDNIGHIYSSNRVLQPVPFSQFISKTPNLLSKIIAEWQSGIPAILWWTLLFGFTFSFIPKRKTTNKYRFPMALLFFPYLLVMLYIQRPYPIARIWLWIYPLFILWSTGGLTNFLVRVSKKFSQPMILYVITLFLALAFTANGIHAIQYGNQNETYVEDTAVKHVTSFLKTQLRGEDFVIVSACSSPRFWYYFERADIPDQVIRKRKRAFEDIYVIVYSESNPSCKSETLENVLEKNGPNIDFLNMDEIELVFEYQYANVYKIGTYPAKIQDAFSTNN